MATILRLGLGSRLVLNRILHNEKSGMLSLVRPVTLKAQPAQPQAHHINHDERNMKLGRPQSPHLTIYDMFQLTTMLSISHRGTGMALAGYTIAFGAAAVCLPDTIPHYLDALADAKVNGACLFIAKLGLAFPMTYHFWNGIRHLLWDMGMFFTLKEIYLTGYAMLVLAVASALALSAM